MLPYTRIYAILRVIILIFLMNPLNQSSLEYSKYIATFHAFCYFEMTPIKKPDVEV